MVSNNYSLFTKEYIIDLILRCVPDAEINNISPFQATSPNVINPFNSASNNGREAIYFGYFTGDSELHLVVPQNAAVLNFGLGGASAPVLFWNIDQVDIAGNWIFTGFQITLNTGISTQGAAAPAVIVPFDGSLVPVPLFLSNDANNSTGAPRLAFKPTFSAGADKWRYKNAATAQNVVGTSATVNQAVAAMRLQLLLTALRASDNAEGNSFAFDVLGDIVPFHKQSFQSGDNGVTITNTINFHIDSPCKLTVITLHKAGGIQIGGADQGTAFEWQQNDVVSLNFFTAYADDLAGSYFLVVPEKGGYLCPFSFKILTGL